ncbi:VWA domain-containing protein, partial [Vibrio coralliilyticus]|uniref:VWA domain-containing protein n=1 Tax=Vibrio coralliilyticus TaxID=190893 RepID=UPI000BC52A71
DNHEGNGSQGEGQQAGDNQEGDGSQGEGQQAGDNQEGSGSQGGDSLKGGENNGNEPVSFHDKDKSNMLQQSLQGYDSSDRVNESEKAFERLLETATDASTIPTPSAEGKPINTNVGLTAEERSNVKMAKGMILRPLRAALKSKDWVKNSFGRRGERLAQDRLYRALIDGKCMETETVSKSENTAVTTLLDMSSSMKDSMDGGRNSGPRRCDVAEQVMLALSSALDQLKVVNSAYFFQTDENTGSIIRPYKTFKEKAKTMEKRIGITPSGGTPTGEALWKALVDINQRREPRKVIYIITDGCAQSATQLQAGYELAESLGIEIYTVLIGLDWKYDFAQDKFCRVFNARDLGRAFKDITIKSI